MATIKEKKNKADIEESQFVHKLTEFIRKQRLLLLALLAAIVLILAVVAIVSLVYNARLEGSNQAMEKARTVIAAYTNEKDEAKKAELKTGLMADLDAVAKKWSGSFAAQEAFFAKANILLQDKDYKAAEETFLSAVKQKSRSYLAPIALAAAALAAEEGGAPDKASDHYKKIIDTYSNAEYPGLTHAYFSQARLAEARSDWATAVANYEKIVATAADSDWARLAKDRLIYIKASGLLK